MYIAGMKEFIDYLLKFGDLNDQQISFITGNAIETELRKDAYFAEAGKVVRQTGFMTEGILRNYYYNSKGGEITKYFVEENNMVICKASFDHEVPATSYLQAVTDCRIIIFPKKNWEEISGTVMIWDSLMQKVISRALVRKVERISPLVSQDATTRYLEFLENYPGLANRVPLSYIGSYLGITQQSLSRIRKNIRST